MRGAKVTVGFIVAMISSLILLEYNVIPVRYCIHSSVLIGIVTIVSFIFVAGKDEMDNMNDVCSWYDANKHRSLEEFVNTPDLSEGHLLNGLATLRYYLRKREKANAK